MEKAVSRVDERTFSLPAEQTSYIDDLVASGAYSSASDVISAGLSALRQRDGEVERWLRNEVVPTYDAMKADPDRARPLEDVRERLRQKHLQRLKDEAR